jgi:Domain of unknown function (DUF5666)
MRKPLIAAVLFGTTFLAAGYTIGQIQGPTASSAAGAVATATTTSPPADRTQPPGGPFAQMGPRADGTVTAINGDTITVRADSDVGQPGEYGNVTTIQLTGATTYEAGHDSATTAGKSSITVGSYLIAKGTLSADGKTLTASQASVMPNGPRA